MKKSRIIVTAMLLAFVAASLTFVVLNETVLGHKDTPGSATPEAATTSPARHYIVYYFHGKARCTNCLNIEQWTHDTLKQKFAAELDGGRIRWQPIDVDEPGNGHYVQDYQLIAKSVVLVVMDGERQVDFKNLTRIWDLLGDREQFCKYIADETRAMLTTDLPAGPGQSANANSHQ